MTELKHLRGVVFDWAGTMIDHGCMAPALVFREIFRQRGVEISIAQAREPMGMAKRAHIAAIAANDEVAKKWKEVHGQACGDDDVDSMYAEFLPLQKATLAEHSQLIEGAADIAAWCRSQGLKIGSSTGYTRELMEVVTAAAADQGYTADCVLCSEDAPQGRPAPYLLFEAAKRLGIFPMWRIVKVDDTPVGIEAGRNAGCWTVGITRTGNGVGMTQQEVAAASPSDLEKALSRAEGTLRDAGAHFVIESVADLRPVLERIDVSPLVDQPNAPGTKF